ncbi:MAG TPA: hypothetical protein VF883_21680 [Thermoanaerobaculia bacterium]
MALTLTFVFACSKQDTAATSDTRPVATSEAGAGSNTSQAQLTPEELGELGARIKATPSDAQKLLAGKGLNEQSFEQAIRKVAENPEESKRYAAAFKKTGA